MDNHIIVAVDPGASGGIAWQTCVDGTVTHGAVSMPETETDLIHFMTQIRAKASINSIQVRMMIEKVGGYVGKDQPASRAFSFAKWYWGPIFAAACMGFRVEQVMPQTWQKGLSLGNSKGMSKGAWKNKLKAEAQRLYPRIKVTLKTADALLILEYALKNR